MMYVSHIDSAHKIIYLHRKYLQAFVHVTSYLQASDKLRARRVAH